MPQIQQEGAGRQHQVRQGSIRSLVAGTLRRLPSPRDEAALALARAARSLVKGDRPLVKGDRPVTDRQRDGSSPAGTGTSDCLVRPTRPVADRPPPPQVEVADPGESAAVRAGWQLVDAHERLTAAGARKVFRQEIGAWRRYAEQTVPVLLDRAGRPRQMSGNVPSRCRRTMDFVLPGDRVFDVGVGGGELACLLLRDRQVASYAGIELLDRQVALAREVVAANGIDQTPFHVQQGDLYRLTAEQVAETGANLIICCEVLEHVPDAELALKTLADALPEGADLLFSVPLHGRLESVWGHCSVFDVVRLQAMLAGAGLHLHHVEPLANTWTIMVASRDRGPSRRVREADRRPAEPTSVPLTRYRDFVDVPIADMASAPRSATDAAVRIRPAQHQNGTDGLEVDSSGPLGGVRFPVNGLEALRLMLSYDDVEHLERLEILVRRKGAKIGGWRYAPPAKHLASAKPCLAAFRPGEGGVSTQPDTFSNLHTADEVQILARVPEGRSARFRLSAAYLP